MPSTPPHPCNFPGCPALTHTRFCDIHAKEHARQYEQYDRDPETRKHYGRAWRKARAAYLSAHPLCVMCEAEGRLVPAEMVHHIVPALADGGNDPTNLQSLCTRHHSSKHMSERSRGG